MNHLQQERRAITRQENFRASLDRAQESARHSDPPRKPATSSLEASAESFRERVEIDCEDCSGTGRDLGGWDPFDGTACSSCNGSGREIIQRDYLVEAFRIASDPESSRPIERKHLLAVIEHCRTAVSTIIALPKTSSREVA